MTRPEQRKRTGVRAHRRPQASYAVAVIVAFIASYAAVQARLTANRVSRDEYKSCLIQRRGLPAGHELASSMGDIHALLTLKPTTKAQRLAAARTPPRVRAIVRDLNMHLATYQALEARQPQTRTC